MADVVLADDFEFDFPVWVMVDRGRFDVVGFPDAYNGISDDNLGMVAAFFTDEELAEEYIDDQGWNKIRPHPLENLVGFRELFEEIESFGISKLAVDPSHRGDRKTRVYELPEVLDTLFGKGEQGPGDSTV